MKDFSSEDTRVTTRHLGDLAKVYLRSLETQQTKNPQEVIKAWVGVIGYPGNTMTESYKFERGVLFVTVKNSTFLSLLQQPTEKKRLIQLLRARVPEAEIVNIEFRFG